MNNSDTTPALAKYFSWIAWLLAIGLLVFVFQDYLDDENNPNRDPKISLSSDGRAEVTLIQNRAGHYVTDGTINDLDVTFLLDTGATQVSIPSAIANELNLPQKGQLRVQTANGSTTVYRTEIEQLSIGNIFLYNIPATINPSMNSDEILLGMSALKQLEFQQIGKKLILREQ